MIRGWAYSMLGVTILSISACTSDKAKVYYTSPPPALSSPSNPNEIATARVKNPKGCFPKEYPHDARMKLETGTTYLVFLIDVDGKAINAKISQSSGWPDLDNAAMAAFLDPACEFYPNLVNGQPVKSWGRIAFAWKLN